MPDSDKKPFDPFSAEAWPLESMTEEDLELGRLVLNALGPESNPEKSTDSDD